MHLVHEAEKMRDMRDYEAQKGTTSVGYFQKSRSK